MEHLITNYERNQRRGKTKRTTQAARRGAVLVSKITIQCNRRTFIFLDRALYRGRVSDGPQGSKRYLLE